MTGVSEQGKTGLLWTIFEGEPFCSRRVASFSDRTEAYEYLQLKDQLASLTKERDELRTALRLLRDYQNGCPLPKYEKGWNEAIRLTDTVLARAELKEGKE